MNTSVDPAGRVAVTSRSFSRDPELRSRLLARYPKADFNDHGKALRGADLVRFLSGHEMAITALETIDEALLAQLPDLKVISKFGVGLDSIDTDALRRRGVRLGWTGGVNRRAVSELVVATAITMLRAIPQAMLEIEEGRWRQVVGAQLTGKTIGIVGLGHIGQDLVQILQPFRCRILANDIRDLSEFCKTWHVTQTTLEELLSQSDLVTLHVPLDNTTSGLLGAAQFAIMKPGAFLINAARGGLLDEAALLSALDAGQIAGAALDVLAVEPPEDDALLKHPRTIVTPHIGGSTHEGILAMGQAAIDGLANARDLPRDVSLIGPLPRGGGE